MSTAANAEFRDAIPDAAAANDESGIPLPLRGDTFLGVFEAIGQDFGFNANWLRVLFAAAILWNPAVIIATYLALGLLVAVSRWMFPVETRAAVAKAAAEGESVIERKDEELAIAA